MSAPMGWDNTTEMVATVVDSLAHLTRQYINVHSERANTDPMFRVPRPYEVTRVIETITLSQFGTMLKED